MEQAVICKKVVKSRKSAEDKHSEIVAVRLTRFEREMLELYVKRENLKLTTLLRSCAIDHVQRLLDDESLFCDVKPEDVSQAKATVARMIEDFKLAVCKTMERMDARLIHLETIAYEQAWITLFSISDINQEDNNKAGALASERLERFKKRVQKALVKQEGNHE